MVRQPALRNPWSAKTDWIRAVSAPLIAILAVFAVPRPALAQASPPAIAFDIPAGTAENSLKIFSQQSGCGIISVTGDVTGVRTNSVRGKFTPADAIKRLLAGTILTATQDEQTHAFAVRVKPPHRDTMADGNSPGGYGQWRGN